MKTPLNEETRNRFITADNSNIENDQIGFLHADKDNVRQSISAQGKSIKQTSLLPIDHDTSKENNQRDIDHVLTPVHHYSNSDNDNDLKKYIIPYHVYIYGMRIIIS